jgi:hypothetical protein
VSASLRAGARAWDAAALALVALGVGLYLRAAAGLREIAAHPVGGGSYVDANQAIAKSHSNIGYVGLTLIAAGLAVGVISYLRTRRSPPASST